MYDNSIIDNLYSRVVLSYYDKLFSIKGNEMLEIIYHMKNPSYSKLSNFLKISMSNLTYRINNLIEKGFVQDMVDSADKRVRHLMVTDKFTNLYCINDSDIMIKIFTKLKTYDEKERAIIENFIYDLAYLIGGDNE